jgi:hypothetical protein
LIRRRLPDRDIPHRAGSIGLGHNVRDLAAKKWTHVTVQIGGVDLPSARALCGFRFGSIS